MVGAAALVLLVRSRRDGVAFGLALAGVSALGWVAADLADYGYGLGFAGGAEATREAVATGGPLPFQLFLALGVVAGAAAVVRQPLRLPSFPRAGGALAGGALMGVGATAAKACNIGHGVTGLGLLSLGSLVAVSAMAAGIVATSRLMRRGRE